MNKFNLFSALAILAWLVVLVYTTTIYAKSEEPPAAVETELYTAVQEVVMLGDVNKLAQEPVSYEDWFRANASVITGCTITHYCCEPYAHICGTGDGITATRVPVTPYWTCAVDPDVIPLGSEVMIDYGDRVEFYKAQDKGGWVKGNHIDLAVEKHTEAIEKGVTSATVYFLEVEYGDN